MKRTTGTTMTTKMGEWRAGEMERGSMRQRHREKAKKKTTNFSDGKIHFKMLCWTQKFRLTSIQFNYTVCALFFHVFPHFSLSLSPPYAHPSSRPLTHWLWLPRIRRRLCYWWDMAFRISHTISRVAGLCARHHRATTTTTTFVRNEDVTEMIFHSELKSIEILCVLYAISGIARASHRSDDTNVSRAYQISCSSLFGSPPVASCEWERTTFSGWNEQMYADFGFFVILFIQRIVVLCS